MKLRSSSRLLVLLLVLGTSASCSDTVTEQTPTITLSATRLPARGWVEMTGSGFTPERNVTSHLLRPDGTEFPPVPILTDSEGGFTHEIDSLLLLVGTHEVWVIDDTAGVTSNVANFEVTRDQPPHE